uniref:Uncharacterized protein n=1 Tax=Timema cristinae TaxID=61476 RepID=A0A7R9CKG3_TIMCR|nr:unnamed protein product [Timema cristinae]
MDMWIKLQILMSFCDSVEVRVRIPAGCCELVERGDITGGLEKLLVCWKVHRQCTYKYSKDLTNCLDQTAKCYAMLGHFRKSVLCLELCLPAVEEQFGPNSIELANELQKVTDVMICELQQIPPHSHKFIKNNVTCAIGATSLLGNKLPSAGFKW